MLCYVPSLGRVTAEMTFKSVTASFRAARIQRSQNQKITRYRWRSSVKEILNLSRKVLFCDH